MTCPECGLDRDTVMPLDAIAAVRSFPRRYRAALTTFDDDEDVDALVRRRPEPETWSALEYTAHAAERIDSLAPIIRRMTVEDNPSLPPGDADGAADPGDQRGRDVRSVLSDMDTACADMAAALDNVGADEWTRSGLFPDGERTILDTARLAVHEGSHHLRDVERVLRQVRGR